MSDFNVKSYYSTRRKRDVVTGAAILLFAALIVFQLYITVVFPLQLRHQRFLVTEIEKDEMYEQIDAIRDLIHHTRGKDSAQSGEIRLVEGVLDQFALHVREHGKEMTLEQVNGLRTALRRYELVIMGWDYSYRGIMYPEETQRDVATSLNEFFGAIDAGEQIDLEKPISFSKFISSDVENKYHIHQDTLDMSKYTNDLQESIVKDVLPLH